MGAPPSQCTVGMLHSRHKTESHERGKPRRIHDALFKGRRILNARRLLRRVLRIDKAFRVGLQDESVACDEGRPRARGARRLPRKSSRQDGDEQKGWPRSHRY